MGGFFVKFFYSSELREKKSTDIEFIKKDGIISIGIVKFL